MRASLKRLLICAVAIGVGTGIVLWIISEQGLDERLGRNNSYPDKPILTPTSPNFIQPEAAVVLPPWDSDGSNYAGELREFVGQHHGITLRQFQFPTGDAALSIAPFRKQRAEWLMNEWQAAARKRGAKLSPEDLHFFTPFIEKFAGISPDPDRNDLQQRADAVSNSRDPMVQFFAAWVRYRSPKDGETPNLQTTLDQAEKVLKEPSPHFLQLMAYYELFHMFQQANHAKVREYNSLMAKNFREWVEESANDIAMQRRIWLWLATKWGNSDAVLDQFIREFRDSMVREVIKAKAIHPWLKSMIAGQLHHDLAWIHRGNGLGHTVTEAGWQGLQRELFLAAQHFYAAYKTYPQHPESLERLCSVALSGNANEVGTPLMWYQQAVQIECDNIRTLDSVLWSMETRWGGSPDDVLMLCEKCLDNPNLNTEQIWVALHALEFLQTDTFGSMASIWKLPRAVKVIERLYALFQNAVERQKTSGKTEPIAPDRRQFRAGLIAILAKGMQLDKAIQLMTDDVNLDLIRNYLKLHYEPDELVLGALIAAKSDAAFVNSIYPQLRAGFERELSDGEFTKLRQELVEHRKSDKNELAQRFYEHAEVILTRSQQFHRGEWVSLSFQNKAAGWQIFAHKHELIDDQSMRIANTEPTRNSYIDCFNRFPLPYAVSFTIEQPARTFIRYAGLTVGDRDTAALVAGKINSRHFSIDPQTRSFSAFSFKDEHLHIAPLPNGNKHEAHVKVWPQRYLYSVGSAFVFDVADGLFDPTNRLSFGGPILPPPATAAIGEFVVSNIRIRKITFQPPPPEGSEIDHPDEFIQYYEQDLKFDGNSPWAKFQLAKIRQLKSPNGDFVDEFHEAYKAAPSLLMMGIGTSISQCYIKKGDYAQAKVWLELQYKEYPRLAPSQFELALFLAGCPDDKLRDGARALTLAFNSLDYTNDKITWYSIHARMYAHAELGKFDRAIKDLDECLKIAPKDQRKYLEELRPLLLAKKPLRIKTE